MNKKAYVWDVSYELSSGYSSGNITKEQHRDRVITGGCSLNDVAAILLNQHKKFKAIVILSGTFHLAFLSLGDPDGDDDAE